MSNQKTRIGDLSPQARAAAHQRMLARHNADRQMRREMRERAADYAEIESAIQETIAEAIIRCGRVRRGEIPSPSLAPPRDSQAAAILRAGARRRDEKLPDGDPDGDDDQPSDVDQNDADDPRTDDDDDGDDQREKKKKSKKPKDEGDGGDDGDNDDAAKARAGLIVRAGKKRRGED